jgi:hypothetical protein
MILPDLSGNHTSSHLVAKQGELTMEIILPYEVSLSYFEGKS